MSCGLAFTSHGSRGFTLRYFKRYPSGPTNKGVEHGVRPAWIHLELTPALDVHGMLARLDQEAIGPCDGHRLGQLVEELGRRGADGARRR